MRTPSPYLALVFLITFLAVATARPAPQNHSQPQPALVDLGYSKYRGAALDAGVNQFLGMRFAAPPVGNLRWRAPRDPVRTPGVIQNATAFGPICLGIGGVLVSTQSEDCLTVNVWTPSTATPSSKLPVWVYIQGGGYVANSNSNYNGTNIIQKSGNNVVFVNFNYRVAAFGFLAGEEVRKEGDLNVGLLDQRKLLHWVQQHIAEFGGDPDHVVIHGVSAGAGSVALHLTAHGGRNDHLFVGAIGESVFFPTQPKPGELEFQFAAYAAAAGCAGNATLACLRTRSTAQLQAANVAVAYPGHTTPSNFPFTPTIDGALIVDYPYALFRQGRFVDVPILFGDDTDEGTNFVANAASKADVATFLQDNFPRLTGEELGAVFRLYGQLPPVSAHAAWYPTLAKAYGDTTFTCAGNFISDSLAAVNRAWNYRYNVLDVANVNAGVGVPHTWETAAIFGVGFAGANGINTQYQTVNAPIIPVVMGYFTSFVRSLDPNRYRAANSPEWLEWSAGDEQRLKLQTNETAMENVPGIEKERCGFWQNIGVRLEQ